jgi:Spy/CpxP family protein refolding chaperone
VLLLVAMAALLSMSLVPVIYGAQDKPITPPASSAMRGAGPDSFHPGMGCMMAKWHHKFSLKAMLKKLGITDEQKLKIRGLYVGFRDRTRKARTDLWSLRDAKKTMVLSGKIDEAKLAQMDDQIVKNVSEVLKEKLKLRRDILAQLTPEQLGRIADWKAGKMFHHRMEMMHRFGGEHRGF